MPFNDESVTDLARTQSAIGALKVIMDTLCYTGDGTPSVAHTLLMVLENREARLDNPKLAKLMSEPTVFDR